MRGKSRLILVKLAFGRTLIVKSRCVIFLMCGASVSLLINPSPVRATGDPPFQFLRYEENYERLAQADRDLWESLKYIPLGFATNQSTYVSFGGEIREEYIHRWNELWGVIPGDYGTFLQRYLLHADLHPLPGVRVFGQLLSAQEDGRPHGPLPYERDRLDVQQLFGEFDLPSEPWDGSYLRVGRQELLLGGHLLLQVREGPNIRLAFDAARLHLRHGPWLADVFGSTVVNPHPGVFDNRLLDDGIEFWGANVGHIADSGTRWDAFYLGYHNQFNRYEQASGEEWRHTFGSRIEAKRGGLEIAYEASAQFGTLANYDIFAYGAATFTGYRWQDVPGKPKVTLEASYVSGDRNHNDRSLNTFNPLFPRGDYFGDTSTLTGANIIDAGLIGEVLPTAKLRVTAQWDALWRAETSDGLYLPALVYFRSGQNTDERFIGNQFTATASYTFNRFLSAQVAYAYFLAGDFLKASPPSEDAQTLTFRLQFRF
jgi:hypothetical protein